MELLKVSVVMPYFNDSKVFRRALESVINQTLTPLEVIVVDDCSEDSLQLVKIIEDYDFNIIYFRNEVNKNGAFSRNRGIMEAKGDIIALLDSDDYWDENHLFENVGFIKNENCDFVYSNIIKFNKTKEYVKVDDIDDLNNKYDILFDNPPQTNSFIFIKDIFFNRKIFFDENLRRHQDWKFFIDTIDKGVKIKYLNKYTSYYCSSIRPLISRVNYDSMFLFWSENDKFFTKEKMEKYILNISVNCKIHKGNDELVYLLKKNKFDYLLNKYSLFFIFLINFNNEYFLKLIYYFFYDKRKIYYKLIKKLRG